MKDEAYTFSSKELNRKNSSSEPQLIDRDLPNYEPRTVTLRPDATYLDANGKVRLSGSEHAEYLMKRFADVFTSYHPDIQFNVDLLGTQTAVPFLIHGRALAVVMGREMSDVEQVPYRKGVGAESAALRIAHTALSNQGGLSTSLAVYVHHSNPLERLTIKDLTRIFTIGNPDGDVSRWGQVGLSGSWTERLIHPIGTPQFSGFGTYMQRYHFGKRALTPFYESHIDGKTVLERLEDDPAGIAVAAIGVQHENLRQIPIAPNKNETFSLGSKEEIQNGTYPLGRFLHLYLRHEADQPLDSLAGEFARFILSREGQAIIASQPSGYLPLREPVAVYQRKLLAEWLSDGQSQIHSRGIDYV